MRRALSFLLSPRLGPLLALLVLFTLAYTFIPDFRKPENFFNIINQNAYVGIVAVGMTSVMILGGIDLSVGAMVGLLAGLGVTAMNAAVAHGWSAPAAMTAGISLILLGGPLLGLVNGSVISVGRVAPFIATLGTMAIFRSAILAVADGGEIRVGTLPPEAPDAAMPVGRALREMFVKIGSGGFELPLQSSRGQPIRLVIPTMTLLAVVLLGELILRKTVPGRRVFAVGDNAVAARYSGIRLWRTTLFAYTTLGACCGLASLLKASQLASASSSQTGANYELDAIAAVVIGGTAMRGGSGSVLGTLIGVVILGMIGNILNMIDPSAPWIGWMSNPHLQGAAKGCIIIAAVLLQRSRSTR